MVSRSAVACRARRSLAPLWLILLAAHGCGSGGGTTATRLEIDPTTLSLTVGESRQLVARAFDASGAPLSVGLAWSSDRVDVATVDGGGLVTAQAPGTATLTVASGSVTTSAALTVTARGPLIVLETSAIAFTAMAGGPSPVPRMVSVASGEGALGGLTATVAYDAGQATGWLAATLDSTSAPSMLTLLPATTGLAVGTYGASVSVGSSSAANTPQVLRVSLTVAVSPPRIALNSTAVNVSVVYQSSTPLVRTVDVANGGGGSLGGLTVAVAYGAPEPPPWLTATLDRTTAPATLTLTVVALASLGDGFIPGTYAATVVVLSQQAASRRRCARPSA
jgi:hypothetical protein